MSSMTDEHGAGGLHGGSEAAGTMTGGPGAAGSMTGGPMEHGSAAGGSAEAGSQNAAGAGAAEDARGRTAGAATVPVSGVAFQHCLPGRHGTLVAGLVWERVTDAPAGLSGLNAAGARTRSGRRSRRSAGQTSGQTFDQTGGQPSGPTLGQAYGQSGGRPSSEACASVYDHRLVQDDLAGLGALSGPAPAPKAPTSLAALILRLRGEGVEIWPLPASRAPEGRTFRSLMEGILAAGKARETGAAPEAAAQASSEDASGSPCCWYVWAARQGRLSARADRCLASREEALRLAASLADSLGLDGVHELSPAQVEAELAALDRLPGSSWRACRLKAIGPARSRRHAGLALAAVAAAGLLMGGQAVWTHWQEGGFSSVSAASEKEKLRNAILAHPERHFAAGFVTAPSAADFARTALPAMLAFPAQASGWQLEALTASVIPEKAQGKAGGASDRNRARDKAPDTADTTDSRTGSRTGGRAAQKAQGTTSAGARAGAPQYSLDAVWRLTPAASPLLPPAGAVPDEKDMTLARERRTFSPDQAAFKTGPFAEDAAGQNTFPLPPEGRAGTSRDRACLPASGRPADRQTSEAPDGPDGPSRTAGGAGADAMKQPFPMTLGHEAAPVPRSWRSLPERKILLQGLAELTARFGLRLQLTWKPVESVPLSPKDRKASARKAGARSARPGSDGTERVLCPWQTATLAWTGVPDSLAWDWASLAEALTLPGVRDGLFLAEARWEKGAWTIRGEVHARR